MNNLFRTLIILALIATMIAACGLSNPQGQADPKSRRAAGIYEDLLGKSINDKALVEFLASTPCSPADQFLLCKAVGMALWMDTDQIVEAVYLYLNNKEGFEPYQGELPFGLKFYDTLGAVQYKLNRQGITDAGTPNTASTPDHVHYRATYDQIGLTILYNSPFPDEDATIYAILLTNKKETGSP